MDLIRAAHEAVVSMSDELAEVFLKRGLVQKIGLKALSS
jgi:hypothetical protein